MVTEVAATLASELVTLHSQVEQYPYFQSPSDSTRDWIPRLSELVDMTSLGQGGQRNPRVQSLPPNADLIHARPREKCDEKEPVQDGHWPILKVEPQYKYNVGERRMLGDGVPQFQPYW